MGVSSGDTLGHSNILGSQKFPFVLENPLRSYSIIDGLKSCAIHDLNPITSPFTKLGASCPDWDS